MKTFEDEPNELTWDGEQSRSSPPGQWNRPLLMAAIALVLMLGGYAATTYVPVTPQQVEQEHRLTELRRLAAQRRADGVEDALPDRLNQMTLSQGNPPYRMAGRLAVYGGLILFVMAGVVMYRSSPPSTRNSDDRE